MKKSGTMSGLPRICESTISYNSSLANAQCKTSTMSWKWWGNKATPLFDADPYLLAFQEATPTYLATNLDEGLGPNGEGYVTIETGRFGNLADHAFTRVWHNSTECTQWTGLSSLDVGGCYGLRATRGAIYMNYDIMKNKIHLGHRLVMLHEIGHLFGLGHQKGGATNCNSFMLDTVGNAQPVSLQGWETSWINSTYP